MLIPMTVLRKGLKMKREIKFRAFDTVIKKMLHDIFPTGREHLFYQMFPKVDARADKIEQFDTGNLPILMQYTGLKDKRGKEIYEGDIVRSGRSIAAVEWSENIDQDFYWGNASGFVFNFDPREMDKETEEFEIIGNIHENPELLK